MKSLLIIIAFFCIAYILFYDLRKSVRKVRNMENPKSKPDYWVLQLKYAGYIIGLSFIYAYFLKFLDDTSIIIFTFLILIAGFIFIMWLLFKLANFTENEDKLKREFNASFVGKLKHKGGLPLASNIVVTVMYGKDNIYFKSENNTIKLSRDKVVYIDTQVGGDFVGGAVAGKAITRNSGWAALSAIASSVELLVITYKSGGKLNKIVLENYRRGNNFPRKVVKDFKESYKNQPGIKTEL